MLLFVLASVFSSFCNRDYRVPLKNQCCGSGMFIPDPGSEFPDFYPSRIQGLKRHLIPDLDPQHCKKYCFFGLASGFLGFCDRDYRVTRQNKLLFHNSAPSFDFFQGCGSVFIFSGSGSSSLGWTPIRIRIQSGSRALMTKNWKKITAECFFYFFYDQTAIYLSLGLHKDVQVIEEAFSSQKRPSNTSKHELLQIFVYFCGSFLPSWIRIRIQIPNPDPDPQTRLNTDPIRIRIHNPGFFCGWNERIRSSK